MYSIHQNERVITFLYGVPPRNARATKGVLGASYALRIRNPALITDAVQKGPRLLSGDERSLLILSLSPAHADHSLPFMPQNLLIVQDGAPNVHVADLPSYMVLSSPMRFIPSNTIHREQQKGRYRPSVMYNSPSSLSLASPFQRGPLKNVSRLNTRRSRKHPLPPPFTEPASSRHPARRRPSQRCRRPR